MGLGSAGWVKIHPTLLGHFCTGRDTAWRMMLTGEPYRGERPLATQRKLRMIRRRASQARDGEAIIATELGFPYAVAPEGHPDENSTPEEWRQTPVPA